MPSCSPSLLAADAATPSLTDAFQATHQPLSPLAEAPAAPSTDQARRSGSHTAMPKACSNDLGQISSPWDTGVLGTPELLSFAQGSAFSEHSVAQPSVPEFQMSPEVLACQEDAHEEWLQSMRASSPEMASEPESPEGATPDSNGMQLVHSGDESTPGTSWSTGQTPCSVEPATERHEHDQSPCAFPTDDSMQLATPEIAKHIHADSLKAEGVAAENDVDATASAQHDPRIDAAWPLAKGELSMSVSSGRADEVNAPSTPGFSFHGSRATRVATPGR